MVQRANPASKNRTISVIKADAGAFGHFWPPQYFSLAAEASLAIMKELGLVKDTQHFSIGDDYETLSVHYRGADDHEIHINSYQIFWRMVYLADHYELAEGPDGKKIIQAKPYGKGQDLVSEAARGKPVPRLAGVTDQVVVRMANQKKRAFWPVGQLGLGLENAGACV